MVFNFNLYLTPCNCAKFLRARYVTDHGGKYTTVFVLLHNTGFIEVNATLYLKLNNMFQLPGKSDIKDNAEFIFLK